VIVYDQTCATEKRRRRKRGRLADPDRFVVINDLVCEGCGDCSRQSNCLSVEPKETPFGRKRAINHSSCNKDESCLKGFCPSFVTVEGAVRKTTRAVSSAAEGQAPEPSALPLPPEPELPATDKAYGIVAAGIGGTGVITIGQILGMAAHLEGKAVVTQDSAGLAQKGGATWSHIQVASSVEAIAATKIDMAKADLILACDSIVAAGSLTLAMMQAGRTRIALNEHHTPTADFVSRPDWQFPAQACRSSIARAAGADQVAGFDAQAMAVALLGDALYANPMLVGFAWQKGWVPLLQETILQAMALNGVQVARNQQAFAWGRHLAHTPDAVASLISRRQEKPIQIVASETLHSLVERRVAFLKAYQNDGYADRYAALVSRVTEAETQVANSKRLSEAVARYFFKLMAYKDEYEVARLHTQPEFMAQLEEQFEGPFRIVHHLAPPLFSRRNAKGELMKSRYGSWVRIALRILAPMKILRGSPLDIFGYSEERRTERALIKRYESVLLRALPNLRPDNLDLFVTWARIPEKIRGYGHVKHRHLQEVAAEWQSLEDALSRGTVSSSLTKSRS
jgi:indolepyruvate ferredoxin oxidoreductase